MTDPMTTITNEINKAMDAKDYTRLQHIARTLENAAKGKDSPIGDIAKTLRNYAAQWLADDERNKP